MAMLDNLLAEAESTQKSMTEAAKRNDERAYSDVVSQRAKFARCMSAMIMESREDYRLKGNPGLSRDFQDRFLDLRQRIAQHQAQFRLNAIEADPVAYRRSADALTQFQKDFYAWAKSVLN
jgi:hypothetical protein